jgi:hypothetical protein
LCQLLLLVSRRFESQFLGEQLGSCVHLGKLPQTHCHVISTLIFPVHLSQVTRRLLSLSSNSRVFIMSTEVNSLEGIKTL